LCAGFTEEDKGRPTKNESITKNIPIRVDRQPFGLFSR
jgi:hypothetical protein